MSQIPLFQQNVFAITSFAEAAPAPGAGFQFTVADHFLLEILSLSFTFTADANPANRNLELIFNVDAITSFTYRDPVSITAGQAYTVAAFPSSPALHPLAAAGSILIPIPRGLVMRATDSFLITPTAMQVGDTLTGINFTTRSWFIV